MQVLYMPNYCTAPGHFPFLVWGGMWVTIGELWPKTVCKALHNLMYMLLDFSYNNCVGMACTVWIKKFPHVICATGCLFNENGMWTNRLFCPVVFLCPFRFIVFLCLFRSIVFLHPFCFVGFFSQFFPFCFTNMYSISITCNTQACPV